MPKVLIAGAGIAGLSASIRLARAGFRVEVVEQQQRAGGKLAEISGGGFRFDAGPSLFTMPWLVTELLDHDAAFDYHRLDTLCHYFFADGSRFNSPADREDFIREASYFFHEAPETFRSYLDRSAFLYDVTAPVFLEKSLHKLSTYLNRKGIRGILNLPRIGMFSSMNQANMRAFSDPRAVQYFNRFATYNGSDPWQAPSTLNVIPHLENNQGAFYPRGGMISIANSLYEQALRLGVTFRFNSRIRAIETSGNSFSGLTLEDGNNLTGDILVSNLDVRLTHKLMGKNLPGRVDKSEPSSSALIFYWGIRELFPELGLHNILFSGDYQAEFEHMFRKRDVWHDPTVYINITSKMEAADAPAGGENWFILINAPHNSGQDWQELRTRVRGYVLDKLKRMLGRDIEPLIAFEDYLDPQRIEERTGSTFGSLYGSSSNSRLSAFFRQANYSSATKGLYFCGGSVHPGGGIPLCLMGGRIASELILSDHS